MEYLRCIEVDIVNVVLYWIIFGNGMKIKKLGNFISDSLVIRIKVEKKFLK